MKRLIQLFALLVLMAIGSSSSAEILTLSTENLSGVSSSLLLAGQLYEITVSGIYDYGNAPDTIADAEYCRPPYWNEIVDGYTYDADILDVVINNSALNWWGSSDGINFAPHIFSPNHVYKTWLIGADNSVHFHIADLYPWGGDATGDNEGSLTIEITAVPEPSSFAALAVGLLPFGMALRRTVKRDSW